MNEVLWTIDPRGWSRPGVDTIVDRVVARLDSNFECILLHDGGRTSRSQTVAALPRIITALRQRHHRFTNMRTSWRLTHGASAPSRTLHTGEGSLDRA